MIIAKKRANGDGTIRQRKDGRWELVVTVGRDPGTGKLIRKSHYCKTQKEAAQLLRKLSSQIDDGTYAEPSKLTLRGWLEIWQKDYIGDVKLSTRQKYEQMMRVHILPAMGSVKLNDLTAIIVQRFYNQLTEKGLSAKTVQCIHGVLHRALKQAAELELIRTNPCDRCKTPRVKTRTEIHPLEGGQIGAFLRAVEGDAFEDLFFVDLFTGMREGEICGLAWDAVNFRAGTITIRQQLQKEKKKGGCHYIASTKNDRVRTITAAPYVMGILKEIFAEQKKQHMTCGLAWKNEWNLVFTRPDGSYIPPQTALKHFKRAAARIGRPDARFHDLRHTYAVTALQEGDSVKTVQANLGHATASFTLDVYGHVSEKMKEESAARIEKFIEKIGG